MRTKTSLILPVEIQRREFDAKLLLACIAAENGRTSFIGCQQAVKRALHRLPPSIFVAKGVTKLAARFHFAHASRHGHAVVASDEEALVYMTRETHMRRKVSEKAMGAAHAFFAWGEDNAEIWRAAPGYGGQPLFVTGNPRIDLLRPGLQQYFHAKAEALRQSHGNFLLVASNFGIVRPFFPRPVPEWPDDEDVVPADRVGTLDDPALLAHRAYIMQAFKTLLPTLTRRFPDLRIIVRPHPSEDPDHWQQAIQGCDNVSVIGEGSVVPWLMAAGAILHNGSTTAVEGFLLGRPAIAYEPIRHPIYDLPLPNLLSHQATCGEKVIELVETVRERPFDPTPEQVALVRHFVADGDGSLAAERIVTALDELTESGVVETRRAAQPRFHRLRGDLRNVRRAPGRWLRADGWQGYVHHRFPDLSRHEVEGRVRRFGKALGRFQDLSVRECGRNIFEIRSN